MINLTRLKSSILAVNPDLLSLFNHVKNYFSGNIANKALGFISIPVMTRLLSQSDYGTLSVFNAYLAICLIVLPLNGHASVGRYYFENKADFDDFVVSSLLFAVFCFLVTGSILSVYYSDLSLLFHLPNNLTIYLFIISLLNIMINVYYQTLTSQRKSGQFAKWNVLQGYSVFGLSVLLILTLPESRYRGAIWANVIISAVIAIYFLSIIFRSGRFRPKKIHLHYIFTYSLPYLPYALSGIILEQIDRIMISKMINISSTGVYSLGYNIGMLMAMVNGSILTAFIPDFFKFTENREYGRLDNLWSRVFVIILLIAAGLIFFSKELIFILVDPKFRDAASVVAPVVMGYVFFQMFYVYSLCIDHAKKPFYSSIILIIAGVANVTLNLLLIPKYGYITAAYTTMISYLLMVILAWVVAKHVLKYHVTPLLLIWKPAFLLLAFLVPLYFINMLASGMITAFFSKVALFVTLSYFLLKRLQDNYETTI